MNCRLARRAVVERGLAPLSAEMERSLQAHLEFCVACRCEMELEDRIVDDLTLLRFATADSFDVTGKVLDRVSRMAPPSRREVPSRQIGWASAAAVIAGLLLLYAFIRDLGHSPMTLTHASDVFTILGQLGLLAVRTAIVAAGIGFKLLVTIGNSLQSLRPLLEFVQPTATMLVAACYMVMLVTVTTIIGRDLRRSPSALSPKEP